MPPPENLGDFFNIRSVCAVTLVGQGHNPWKMLSFTSFHGVQIDKNF